MLIHLVRTVFVLLAVLVGMTSGRYFYGDFAAQGMPTWFGGAIGFGVAITLIAAEQGFRRRFTRSLVAFLIGLSGGLLLSWLLLSVISLAIQDPDLRYNLDVPLALVTTYLVLVTVLRNADRFRVLVPFFEFRNEGVEEGVLVVDATALGDARLRQLLDAGLLDRRLLLHRSVAKHCRALADAEEPAQRLRGQRMLEAIEELQQRLGERLVSDDTEIPQAGSLTDLLVGLAHLEGARLLTADAALARRARGEGLRVLDLQVLGRGLASGLRPGEILSVAVEKRGEGEGQGIGFLEDGSMAVVEGAAGAVGRVVRCTILRLHHTSAGRMVFAEIIPAEPPSDTGQPPR